MGIGESSESEQAYSSNLSQQLLGRPEALDTAKKNITFSITSLKRLIMLSKLAESFLIMLDSPGN